MSNGTANRTHNRGTMSETRCIRPGCSWDGTDTGRTTRRCRGKRLGGRCTDGSTTPDTGLGETRYSSAVVCRRPWTDSYDTHRC